MCLGIPGQIVEISNVEHKLAIVEVGGVRREVNIACIVDEPGCAAREQCGQDAWCGNCGVQYQRRIERLRGGR